MRQCTEEANSRPASDQDMWRMTTPMCAGTAYVWRSASGNA